jgi:NAD-dependent deacetylase
VVWFGELPLELDAIYDALAGCALFVAIGTSGQVYPAAGFVEAVRASGLAHTVELKLEPKRCQPALRRAPPRPGSRAGAALRRRAAGPRRIVSTPAPVLTLAP